ncbi:MAG: hypothetical protein WBV35_09380 [Steroidobacteraceae bacterium]
MFIVLMVAIVDLLAKFGNHAGCTAAFDLAASGGWCSAASGQQPVTRAPELDFQKAGSQNSTAEP